MYVGSGLSRKNKIDCIYVLFCVITFPFDFLILIGRWSPLLSFKVLGDIYNFIQF